MTAENSLWSSLLKESSKRSSVPPSATVVVLGDVGVGKGTFIRAAASSSTRGDAAGGTGTFKDVLSYGYLDVDDISGSGSSHSSSGGGGGGSSSSGAGGASGTRLDFWGVSDATFDGCLDAVTAPETLPVAFVVAVDASQPADACVASATKWLAAVRQWVARRGGGTAPPVLWAQLGSQVPVVLVACKADLVRADDAASLKRAKALQGQLREVGMAVGAAVVYVSATADTNVARLTKYLVHRLFQEPGAEAAAAAAAATAATDAVENGIASAFVPAGADSASLVAIATGHTVAEDARDITASLDQATQECTAAVAARAVSALEPAPAPAPKDELEDEDEWLAGLQKYIAQATATVGGTAAAPATATATAAATHAPAAAAPAAADAPPPAPAPRRSTRAQAAQAASGSQKEDVGDFFKNLLNAPAKK
jgi:hypothetical protein